MKIRSNYTEYYPFQKFQIPKNTFEKTMIELQTRPTFPLFLKKLHLYYILFNVNLLNWNENSFKLYYSFEKLQIAKRSFPEQSDLILFASECLEGLYAVQQGGVGVVPGGVQGVVHREAEVVFVQLNQRRLQLFVELQREGKLVGFVLVMATEHVHSEAQNLVRVKAIKLLSN